MSRNEIVTILYRGGQAAIAAEILVIVGMIIAFLAIDPAVYSSAETDILKSYEIVIHEANRNPVLFVTVSAMIMLIPSMAILVAVWAWHLYLASEGIHLMNWVATSIAIVGVTLQMLSFGFGTIAALMVMTAIDNGQMIIEDAYPLFIATEAIQTVGIMALFVVYPFMLVLAGWKKQLLPRWFVLITLLFGSFNDINLMTGQDNLFLAGMMQFAVILWPFILGTVLLHKAQILATEAYIDSHGTTPPEQPSLLQSLHSLISTPASVRTKAVTPDTDIQTIGRIKDEDI